jgi:integrase/recombinase XerD
MGMTGAALDVIPISPVTLIPAPSTAALKDLRDHLGYRRPVGSARTDAQVARLDLLVDALDAGTARLVLRWLGGEHRASVTTKRAYVDDLLLWAEWVRTVRGRDRLSLPELSRNDVDDWLIVQRAAGRSSATIARRLATLSSLYRYAASRMPIVSPIDDDEHRPRVRHGRSTTSARVLAADEVAAMLAAASDLRDALVVGLLFTDALRVSEIVGANVDDVSTAARRLWLTVTRKGGDRARVPLDPAVAELLDAYLADRPSWTGPDPTPLLLDREGNRLDRFDVARMIRRLARRAGIDAPTKVGPHSLRASAITDQIDRGRPATEVQVMAGHQDVRTTLRYYERRDADDRNAAMAADLARVLSAVPAKLRGR